MNEDKIISHFGEGFYHKILRDIDRYSGMWSLSALEQINYYSINCIFRCISAGYGLCILKIGNDAQAAESEYRVLSEYRGSRFCGVYEADIVNGVLLLECVVPAARLRDEPDLGKRIGLFCELFSGLHIKPLIASAYPSYMDWVNRITGYMGTRGEYKLLHAKMERARLICRRLCAKYRGKMLLHGDLHHDNILLGENGVYRIVDPKGVVGDSVFDIPRFILNEFDDDMDDAFTRKFAYITKTISERLNIPEYDVRSLVYVEMCRLIAGAWKADRSRISARCCSRKR